MSGVGTKRYCAPEVVLGEGYNLQVDLYSLTIVLYEMMSHPKPFGVIGPESHRLLVVRGQAHYRPCFDVDGAAKPQDRPTMKGYSSRVAKIECGV
jgi:serine/threonine protein kinase